MSAPVVSSAVASAVSSGTSTRKAADTTGTAQGAADAPTDLFQDLMQAFSVMADTSALPGTGNPPALADGSPSAENTLLPAEPADNLTLPPDYLGLGLVFAQTLPALPSAIPLTVNGTLECQAQPQGDLTITTTGPVDAGTVSDTSSPTQALLDMVRGQAMPSPTSLPSAASASTPSTLTTQAKQALTQERGAFNPMVAAEQSTGKTASLGWATALNSAAASATTKGQDLPLDPTPQPAIPETPDAASGIRQTTANTLDTSGVYRNTLQAQPSSPAFPTELVSEVRFLLKGGLQHAELQMNPVELGPIQIELSLNAQVADIGFTAAHAATREGIAQSLPQLREMLSSQGLSLGHTSVGTQAQEQQQAQQERTRPDASPSRTGSVVSNNSVAVHVGGAVRSARGVLDLYA